MPICYQNQRRLYIRLLLYYCWPSDHVFTLTERSEVKFDIIFKIFTLVLSICWQHIQVIRLFKLTLKTLMDASQILIDLLIWPHSTPLHSFIRISFKTFWAIAFTDRPVTRKDYKNTTSLTDVISCRHLLKIYAKFLPSFKFASVKAACSLWGHSTLNDLIFQSESY